MNHDANLSDPKPESTETVAPASPPSTQELQPSSEPPPAAPTGLVEAGATGLTSPLSSAGLDEYVGALLALPPVEPWPEPVDGCGLLDDILKTVTRFAV